MNKKPDDTAPLFELESAFVDVDAIETGTWLDLGADFPGVAILAVGLTSKTASKYQGRLERESTRSQRLANGQLTTDRRDEILREVVAAKCVLDWRGIGKGGKPLPFDRDLLRSLLNEPKSRLVAAAIINAIVDLETRKVHASKEIAGN